MQRLSNGHPSLGSVNACQATRQSTWNGRVFVKIKKVCGQRKVLKTPAVRYGAAALCERCRETDCLKRRQRQRQLLHSVSRRNDRYRFGRSGSCRCGMLLL